MSGLDEREMALLNTSFFNTKTRQILFHHHLHHIKPLNSVQFPQFPNTHLSNHLRNPSLRCFSQKQSQSTQKSLIKEEEELGKGVEKYEFERLFSNLNQATLKHEPGSLSSSIFLVAGTTIGAGILAIPAVTQESGFLASAVACIGCWVYMVATGLLIAEVNVNTMCELDSGGVSLVSMAKRTVGSVGVQVACWSYIFIHYALLVAYIARSSDILTNYLGIPLWESAGLFSLAFGGLCYFGSQRIIGAVNGLLVLGIITAFTALVVVASADLHLDALLKANFEAVPSSIPVIALAYVYHNVVPVLCTNLEGDLSKVRTAVVVGTAIPLLLFLVWNGVILGTFTNLDSDVGKILDPLQELRSSNGVVGPIVDTFSIFAIGTSYIGFVLGLADFLADCAETPSWTKQTTSIFDYFAPTIGACTVRPRNFFQGFGFCWNIWCIDAFRNSSRSNVLVRPILDFARAPKSAPAGSRRKSYTFPSDGWRCMGHFIRIIEHFQSLEKFVICSNKRRRGQKLKQKALRLRLE